MTFVPESPIDNMSALAQIMARCCTGNKPLSEPVLTRLPDAIWCVIVNHPCECSCYRARRLLLCVALMMTSGSWRPLHSPTQTSLMRTLTHPLMRNMKWRLVPAQRPSLSVRWKRYVWIQIDGLVQERRNSSALAMELRLSCTIPSKWSHVCTLSLCMTSHQQAG